MYLWIFFKHVFKYDLSVSFCPKQANLEVIKKKNLLLFILRLDNIQKKIQELKSIAKELKEKDKQDYGIIWIPIVDNWSKELKVKFENIKCKVPWYVVRHFGPLRGIRILRQVFHYKDTHILVANSSTAKYLLQLVFPMVGGPET